MPSATKSRTSGNTHLPKGSSASSSKISSTKKSEPLPSPAPVIASSDSSEESDEDDENEGVDEEGMRKLMNALGDDGLDEFEIAQLDMLAGSDDEDSDGDEDEDASEEDEESEDVREEQDNVQYTASDGGDDASAKNSEEDATDEETPPLALDDVEDSVDEDAVPQQKLEIDNQIALERIRDITKLDASLPWTETLIITYPESINVDIEDDLNRELAFYKQALHGADLARKLASKHDLPFTRPSDYFAEMVKSDAHMERIRQRLLDEGASIKRSEQKRKEREGKKFGKQVQLEKIKERERGKKEMEERLKGLKRKRKGALDNAEADDEAFDVAVEDAISDRPAKRGKSGADNAKLPRHARDKKFGFGSAGRRSKQNTKSSTDDFGGSSASRGRGGHGRGRTGGAGRGAKRLGKSRRAAVKAR